MVLVLISMGAQAINHRHQKRKASRQSRSLSPEEAEQATSQSQTQPQSQQRQPQLPNPTPTIQRTRNPAKRLFSKSCHNNNNTNRKSIIGALCTTTTTATSIITPLTIQNISTTTSPDQQEYPIHEIPYHEIQTSQPQHYASSEYSNTTTLSPYSSAAPSIINSNYLTNTTNDNMPFSPDDIGRNISRRQTPFHFELEAEEEPPRVSELQGDNDYPVGGTAGVGGFGAAATADRAADWAWPEVSPRHICAWSPDYGIGYLWAGNEDRGQSRGQSRRGEGEGERGGRWDRFDEGEIVQECVVRPLVPRRSSARMWSPSDQRRVVELEG